MKHCVLTLRPKACWYNENISAAKRKRRQLERKYVRTRSAEDKTLHDEQCKVVSSMILEAKRVYYNSAIMENEKNQKDLFQIVERLLHRKGEPQLPSHDSPAELATRFAEYFTEKINIIRENLEQRRSELTLIEEENICNVYLTDFQPATEDEVKRLIMDSASKSCSLDPIPTTLLKDCITLLLPLITNIVNLSMSTSDVPENMKEAIILPLIKKIIMDCEILKNFRPVSNLTFVSKILEKVVAVRVRSHVLSNNLQESLQSAYQQYHSTETALVKVQSDILNAIDRKQAVLLVLLDLSAAFDTVDHQLLLKTLTSRFGIKGNALAWFASYLSGRKQAVCIKGVMSEKHELTCGVPQGSVLGPILFTMYTQPLGDLVRKHGISHHLYADDTQIYITFSQSNNDAMLSAKSQLEACVEDIRNWMTTRLLKLNDDKTEFILIQSRYVKPVSAPPLLVGQAEVDVSPSARNIGVVFDEYMSMDSHVTNVAKISFFHLRNIGKIRKNLTVDSTKTITHAFVSSKLDYCNSLLAGLPAVTTDKLQAVQDSAARIVMCKQKYDHLTPLYKDLHWLPIKQRIIFKVLLLTYKVIHGMCPDYMKQMIRVHQPPRKLRSGEGQMLLCVPKARLVTYGFRSFTKVAPEHWNALPKTIRLSSTVEKFKSQLKTYLFKQCKYGDKDSK